MVSHELRTPLISIKGSTATVLDASPVPETAGWPSWKAGRLLRLPRIRSRTS